MTDIHTHILPKMDDGAKSVEMSLDMLRMEWQQGVDTVVLTPHCYREMEEPQRFLERRAYSFKMLNEAVEQQPDQLPKLLLGAEVAWVPNLVDWPELPQLCIQGTSYMLLEMPFHPWNDRMIHQLYDFVGKRGITPVFAHLERYIKIQDPSYIDEIVSLGTPIQVSAQPLLEHWSGRRLPVKMLRKQVAQLVGSDCHNTTSRPPNLGPGMKAVERLLGKEMAEQLKLNSDRLISEDSEF